MRRRQFITPLARPNSGWPQDVRVQHSDWVHLIVTLSGMAYMLSSPSALSQELSQGTEAASEQQLYNNACRTCHTIKEGDNRLGPTLYKIIGRKAGSLPDYNYSSAMKGAGFIWDEEKLEHLQYEAVWRSRIDRRQNKSHRFPAIGHDWSTVTRPAT